MIAKNKKRIFVTLPDDVILNLEKYADFHNVTKSEVIEMVLKECMIDFLNTENQESTH